jgi:PilZ domain
MGECTLGIQERREGYRYAIKLPLLVRWASAAGAREIVTVSEDVSSRGIYFTSPTELASGSSLEIVMTLLREVINAGPVRVRCLGRILRVHTEGQAVGVAAKIDGYEFLRKADNAE